MAGLDALPDAQTVARIASVAAGIEPRGVRPLGDGSSSVAWRVESDGEPVIVLVQKPGDVPSPRYAAQLALLDRLYPIDAHVPRPFGTSHDEQFADVVPAGLPWAVIGAVDGEPGGLTDEGARDLGRLLATLHSIACSGYGRLEDRRDALRGESAAMAAGLLQRWPAPWPFDGSAIIGHVVARSAPQLIEGLSRLREPLLGFNDIDLAVPLHCDLTQKNVLLVDGRLGGLIDFGDLLIGPPALDIASFAYCFGWTRVEPLLEVYEANGVMRDVRRAEAQMLSVVIALHQLQKQSAAVGRPTGHPLDFLAETLPLALAVVPRG